MKTIHLPGLATVVGAALAVALTAAGALARPLGTPTPAPGAGTPPPAETTERLAATIRAPIPKELRGSLTIRTVSVVSRPSGKGREESVEVQRVSQHADGSGESVIVLATENGRDVTEEKRQEHLEMQRKMAERARAAASGGSDTDEATRGHDFRLPAGKDLAIYAFSSPVESDGLLVASFEPLPQHREEEEAMRGTLAWRADTLDPAWIEMSFADPPPFLKEMTFRFEVKRLGTALCVSRMVVDGVGGLLFIKRRFHAEMEVTDILLDSPSEP